MGGWVRASFASSSRGLRTTVPIESKARRQRPPRHFCQKRNVGAWKRGYLFRDLPFRKTSGLEKQKPRATLETPLLESRSRSPSCSLPSSPKETKVWKVERERRGGVRQWNNELICNRRTNLKITKTVFDLCAHVADLNPNLTWHSLPT